MKKSVKYFGLTLFGLLIATATANCSRINSQPVEHKGIERKFSEGGLKKGVVTMVFETPDYAGIQIDGEKIYKIELYSGWLLDSRGKTVQYRERKDSPDELSEIRKLE